MNPMVMLGLRLRYWLWDRWTFDRTHSSNEDPIHSLFGLSKAHYYVVPRTVLQSMPESWQQRFVRCIEELDQSMQWYDHLPRDAKYEVRLVERESMEKLPPGAMKQVDAQLKSWPVAYEPSWDEDFEGDRLKIHGDPLKEYHRGARRILPQNQILYGRLD